MPLQISPNCGFPTHKQAPGTSVCAPCVPLNMGKTGNPASTFLQTFVYAICLHSASLENFPQIHLELFMKSNCWQNISFDVFKGKLWLGVSVGLFGNSNFLVSLLVVYHFSFRYHIQCISQKVQTIYVKWKQWSPKHHLEAEIN